jgi:hypothetical protein
MISRILSAIHILVISAINTLLLTKRITVRLSFRIIDLYAEPFKESVKFLSGYKQSTFFHINENRYHAIIHFDKCTRVLPVHFYGKYFRSDGRPLRKRGTECRRLLLWEPDRLFLLKMCWETA